MVDFLLPTRRAERFERLLRSDASDLHVPALCDVEFVAAVRRALRWELLSGETATEVIEDYVNLPISRHGHETLIPRILELRENFSAYDAMYVALAEAIGGALLTGDGSLVRATNTYTAVETIHV